MMAAGYPLLNSKQSHVDNFVADELVDDIFPAFRDSAQRSPGKLISFELASTAACTLGGIGHDTTML